MLSFKDYYYVSSIITGLLVILIINNNIKIKTNKYVDIAFFIGIMLLSEIDIKYSILLTFIYLAIKIKDNKDKL